MDRREAAIVTLITKHGGVAGAVRRIVFSWHGRFSCVQIRIALGRRYPLLVPNTYQVEDSLDDFERRRLIACVAFKHSKLYERIKKEPHEEIHRHLPRPRTTRDHAEEPPHDLQARGAIWEAVVATVPAAVAVGHAR
jgi:hypothetical protein